MRYWSINLLVFFSLSAGNEFIGFSDMQLFDLRMRCIEGHCNVLHDGTMVEKIIQKINSLENSNTINNVYFIDSTMYIDNYHYMAVVHGKSYADGLCSKGYIDSCHENIYQMYGSKYIGLNPCIKNDCYGLITFDSSLSLIAISDWISNKTVSNIKVQEVNGARHRNSGILEGFLIAIPIAISTIVTLVLMQHDKK